jgi:phage tail protein X
MALQRPGIAKPNPNLPHGLNSVLEPMKENIDIANGLADWQRQFVSLGTLVRLQIITVQQAQAINRGEI